MGAGRPEGPGSKKGWWVRARGRAGTLGRRCSGKSFDRLASMCPSNLPAGRWLTGLEILALESTLYLGREWNQCGVGLGGRKSGRG